MQGTDEWYQARCGVVTASRFADVLATIRSGEAAARYNYKAEIIAERLTNCPATSFTTTAMQWGTNHEPEAREVYHLVTGHRVEEVGLVKHATLAAGASPDGLVETDGLIEIKCPNTATHIATILEGKVPRKYLPQIQGQMWITGRKWCDFISYDPRLNDKLAFFMVRVERDEEYIKKLEEQIVLFLEEVDELLKELGA